MKKKSKVVLVIIIASIILVLAICTSIFKYRNMTTKFETDLYSVSVSKQWNIEEPFDDCQKFMLDGNEVAYIETFRDCSYATSVESIAVNVFGEHSSFSNTEETVLGNWTKYKIVIDYELSAAQEMQGETVPTEEIHYIYTNKNDAFIDVYANSQLLNEDEIQKLIDSFKIK